MSGIKRHPICVEHGRVESALHVVHRLRDELQPELGIGVQVVEQNVGAGVAVAELGVRSGGDVVDAVGLPLRDVVVGNLAQAGR